MEIETLPALNAIAKKRDHANTNEFAEAFDTEPQTVRKYVSRTGECYGVRPVKVGGKWLWPLAKMAARLQGGAK